jgi:HlyD family secretion protein
MRRPRSRPRHGHFKLAVTLLALAGTGAAIVGVRYLTPRSVQIFSVERGDLVVTLKASGTLDATNRAAVASRVQGRLTDLAVATNDSVAKGDVIARIASDDLQSVLAAAAASWQAAQLATRQAEADRQRAEILRDDARQTLERQKQLLQNETISQSIYDAASSALETAEAGVTSADAAVDRARALEQSAQAGMDGARIGLEEAVIVAPFGGTVVDTRFHAGDIVSPGQSIVELADPDSLVLTARLDESVISRIHVGDTATLRFGGDQSPIPATVVGLGRVVDTETREFTVDIKPVALPENWAIGQRGVAVIETSRLPDALAIPTDLLETRAGQKGVWVVQDDRTRWRAVVLGDVGGDRVAVLDGLDAGDRLISPQQAYPWMLVASGTSGQ